MDLDTILYTLLSTIKTDKKKVKTDSGRFHTKLFVIFKLKELGKSF